jgi:hypothetical protein
MNSNLFSGEALAIHSAIMDYYHAGHALYAPELYDKILHPEWKFFLLEDGKLKIVDRDEFNAWYAPENRDPALEWETEVYSIDITAEIATVKLRIENQRVRYIDYLNLMKIDGIWWIVHKLSHEIRDVSSA